MPGITIATPLAYDTVSGAMNAAQVRLGNNLATLEPVSGKLGESMQAFSQQAVNSAWRKLQDHLANLGYSRLRRQIVLSGFPTAASTDPTSQCFLNWYNYFDGVTYWNSPVLPVDLVIPLIVWERQTGSNTSFGEPMALMPDGFQGWAKQSWNRVWEWRDDAIWMPGSQVTMDLQIAYTTYLPDFATIGVKAWYEQFVPIMRSQDALAWFICAEAMAKEPEKAAVYRQYGEQAANAVMNRDIRLKQRTNVRRMSRSGREFRSCNGWGF